MIRGMEQSKTRQTMIQTAVRKQRLGAIFVDKYFCCEKVALRAMAYSQDVLTNCILFTLSYFYSTVPCSVFEKSIHLFSVSSGESAPPPFFFTLMYYTNSPPSFHYGPQGSPHRFLRCSPISVLISHRPA